MDDIIANRAAQMSESQFDENLKDKIILKLIAEHATDLSDSELERCLKNCAATWLVRRAKMYRDCDFMYENDLLKFEKTETQQLSLFE